MFVEQQNVNTEYYQGELEWASHTIVAILIVRYIGQIILFKFQWCLWELIFHCTICICIHIKYEDIIYYAKYRKVGKCSVRRKGGARPSFPLLLHLNSSPLFLSLCSWRERWTAETEEQRKTRLQHRWTLAHFTMFGIIMSSTVLICTSIIYDHNMEPWP